MRRLGILSGLTVLSLTLGLLPSALASSFTFTTFDVTFVNTINTESIGINIHGTAVGDTEDAAGNFCHGFLRTPDGSLIRIDVPFAGVGCTTAFDINNIGLIVGQYFNAAGGHCFVLNAGLFTTLDVPFPGAFATGCRGINDHGQIVGRYRTRDPQGRRHVHGFLFSGGTFQTIDVAGATDTVARRINNAGDIVGRYVVSGANHGFLLAGGTFTTIDFPGAKETVAAGINDRDQIVGTYRDPSDNVFGFLKTRNNFAQVILPGVVQNVGPVINFSTLDFVSAIEAINDRGEITGESLGGDGRFHGFIGTPTP